MTEQKEKQKETRNPRMEQHGMCGIQHSPLHRVVSVNDLIGDNVSTNAHVSADLVASHETTRMEILDSGVVYRLHS